MSRRSLWIGNLEGQTVFAQLLPLLGPRFMQLAFRIVRGRIGARKFDGVDSAEVSDLIAFGFQPHILDPRNLRRHGLDSVDGVLLVALGDAGFPLVNDDVQNRLGLAESVLRRNAACVPVSRGSPGEK